MAVTEVESAVAALVGDTYAALERIGAGLADVWDGIESRGGTPASADLAVLRGVVFAELADHTALFNGAGVVLADGVLADRRHFMEWWRNVPTDDGSTSPLQLDFNPSSEYFYDYPTMEWFTVPRDAGVRTVHGPYLDFTGVDISVCTFAVPVLSCRGQFLGIAGADVPVSAIDAALMPVFRDSGQPLALVNAHGRVIVANDPDHLPGSRLRTTESGTSQTLPDVPWSLVRLGN